MSNLTREKESEEENRYEQIADVQPSNSDNSSSRFARGGPIYVPNLVSSITTVFEFEAAMVQELQSLEVELRDVPDCEDELSVDELKVLTEEELIEMALNEDFDILKSGKIASCLSVETTDDVGNCNAINGIASSSTDVSISSTEANDGIEGKRKQKKGRKRGRVFDRDVRAAALEGAYFTKVEQLSKILQRQKEDKAAAQLHSFNGGSQPAEDCVATTSERKEKMQALRFITTPLQTKPSFITKNIPVTYPEVVLSVEVFSWEKSVRKTQEFLVLGRQRLTELVDQIYCLTDQLMQEAGKANTSGYFLIEDFFCNDLRDPSAVDYSEPILDWLKNKKLEAEAKWEYVMSGELKQKQKELLRNTVASSLPNFKAINMDETRFCDLKFRLGSGYLYCHQGNCRHIIVIRDMRLIHPEDAKNMAAYPLCTFQTKVRRMKCSVCDICMAKKLTFDDKWAQKNPCHFCDNCYFLLHYSKDGSLLYDDFTVYDYFHE